MITTSLDGQWATVRRGREVTLFAGAAAPPVGRLELEGDDADLAFVGPPALLAVVTRAPEAKVMLYQPPYLDAVARLDLDGPMKLAAVTGTRLVLTSPDGKHVMIVRAAARALAAQALDPGTPVEFAVGLEKNQVLLGLTKKLEVWDAVSTRPLLRLQLQLPPPPRTIGAAQGHLWVTRSGTDEVFVYRLSDGRPFPQVAGSPVHDVICHPGSPLVVLVTAHGLLRLHCFAHTVTPLDAPWTPGVALGLLVNGEDISLIGAGEHDPEPWRVPIAGAGAPAIVFETSEPVTAEPALPTAADRLRAMRERGGSEPAADAARGGSGLAPDPARPSAIAARGPSVSPLTGPSLAQVLTPMPNVPRSQLWRETLATYGAELARGADAELPVVAVDTELGALAHRLGLPAGARRALGALYALYLIGEPALPIARLARVLGDWTEALGQGELGALAMLRRRGGRVALGASVTDLLDGLSPRAIRMIGGTAPTSHPGAARLARDGRTDATIESELATQLGRIGVIVGAPALALLEARLHGATALALAAPIVRPLPWPREAALIVVADPAAPAWVAALPAFAG